MPAAMHTSRMFSAARTGHGPLITPDTSYEDDLAHKRREIVKLVSLKGQPQQFTIKWDAKPYMIRTAVEVVLELKRARDQAFGSDHAIPLEVWREAAEQLQDKHPSFFGRDLLTPSKLAPRLREKIVRLGDLYRFWVYWGSLDQKGDVVSHLAQLFGSERLRKKILTQANQIIRNGYCDVYEQCVSDFVLETTAQPVRQQLLLMDASSSQDQDQDVEQVQMSEIPEPVQPMSLKQIRDLELGHERNQARDHEHHHESNHYENHQRQHEPPAQVDIVDITQPTSGFQVTILLQFMHAHHRTDVREGILSQANQEESYLCMIHQDSRMLDAWVKRTAKSLFPLKEIRLGYDEVMPP